MKRFCFKAVCTVPYLSEQEIRFCYKMKVRLCRGMPPSDDHLRCHDERTGGRLICRWTRIIGETGDGRRTRGGLVSSIAVAAVVWSDGQSRMFWERDVKQTHHQFAPRRFCSHSRRREKEGIFGIGRGMTEMLRRNPIRSSGAAFALKLVPCVNLGPLDLEHGGG